MYILIMFQKNGVHVHMFKLYINVENNTKGCLYSKYILYICEMCIFMK